MVIKSNAQVGIGTTTPDNSSILHLNSTTKGILIPKMTAQQRIDIESPANGLMVFDIDVNQFYYYNGTAWVQSIGPTGNSGTDGVNGKTILSSTTNPATGIGVIGDFYLNTNSETLFGPKSGSGWGAGVSLVGSQGIQGSSGTVNNGSITYANAGGLYVPKSNIWQMVGGGDFQAVVTPQGVLVNMTISARALQSSLTVRCNICYGLTNTGTGTPIYTSNGDPNILPTQLSDTMLSTVTLTGLVEPPTAGTYWIAPCFKSSESFVIYGVMGYYIIL